MKYFVLGYRSGGLFFGGGFFLVSIFVELCRLYDFFDRLSCWEIDINIS